MVMFAGALLKGAEEYQMLPGVTTIEINRITIWPKREIFCQPRPLAKWNRSIETMHPGRRCVPFVSHQGM